MLRDLVDLGLRSSKVVVFRLDDIDGQAGIVRLVKPKSRRTDVLRPLCETGRTISSYVVCKRLQTVNQTVSFHQVAPYDDSNGTGAAQRGAQDLSKMRLAIPCE